MGPWLALYALVVAAIAPVLGWWMRRRRRADTRRA